MKHFIYAALIGAMGFASCANDDVVSNNQTTNGALKINAGIALHKVTRAFDNQWNKGDEIGVYLLNAGTTTVNGDVNYQYKSNIETETAEEGNFAPVSKNAFLPSDGSAVDVVAYYPYTTDIADGVRSISVADQSNQAAIDLLQAKATNVTRLNPTANLSFSHKLTKLYFTFTSTSGVNLDRVTATIGNQHTNINYNVLQDAISLKEGDATQDITLRKGDSYLEAIVIPNTVDGNAAANRTLTFTIGGEEYKATLSSATSFEAGKKYMYNVEFSQTGVTLTGAGITPWTEVSSNETVVISGGIKDVYLFGNPTNWDHRDKLTAKGNGVFEWKGNIYKNQELKFTLEDNGDYNTYQLMPNASGRENKTIEEGESTYSKVLYNDDNDNKWVASKHGYYTITIDTKTSKIKFEQTEVPVTQLYAVGDALPSGWDLGNAPKFTQDPSNAKIFTLDVTLRAGSFKLPLWLNSGFECDFLMPENADAPLTARKVVRRNYPNTYDGNDTKWKVESSEAGDYTITVNLEDMTMTAVKKN